MELNQRFGLIQHYLRLDGPKGFPCCPQHYRALDKSTPFTSVFYLFVCLYLCIYIFKRLEENYTQIPDQ